MGNKKKQKKGKNKKNNTSNTNKNKNTNKDDRRKKREKKAKEYHKQFIDQLKALGLRINEVGGDGNCFFRSVCDQLEGSEDNHFYYRALACDYIEENKDFIKFFIEDDIPIEKYISDMRRDGVWGGNIEIYSLSQTLNVNFYIFLYDRPMYIVKNFEIPNRNIYLSYHDAMHYNSVRLLEDFSKGEIPISIPLDLLTGVSKSQDAQMLNDNDNDIDSVNDESNEESENENEEQTVENEKKKKDDKMNKEDKEKKEKKDNFVFKGISICSIEDLSNNERKNLKKKKLSLEGIIYDIPKGKCYCSSNRKYKNCHEGKDVEGEFNTEESIFFCNLTDFSLIFSSVLIETQISQKDNKEVKEMKELEKKLEMIYI